MTIRDLDNLSTECSNPNTTDIDLLSTRQLLQVINEEDTKISDIVANTIPVVEKVVDHLVPLVKKGGRLFYLGAGTSGRLGVLDASEIPPTYSTPFGQFVGLIAGGDVALRKAVEASEDNEDAAAKDLQAYDLNPELDTILGIASSGRTPYAVGALKYGKDIGCTTIGLACVRNSVMEQFADYMIACDTGAEVVTGSTRMKAGTATKLVLNMISTSTMIKVGKTFGNLMIDLNPSNIKLRVRTRRIFRAICGEEFFISKNEKLLVPDNAEGDNIIDKHLEDCGSLKVAIVVARTGVSVQAAAKVLEDNGGVLREALSSIKDTPYKTSGTKVDPFSDKSLCIDIIGTEIRMAIFNNQKVHSDASRFEDMTTELTSLLNSLCSEITKGQIIDLSGVKSIRVAFEKQEHQESITQLLLAFKIIEEKVQYVNGTLNLVDLVTSLVNR